MTLRQAVGADPEALGQLAVALEQLGDELEHRHRAMREALATAGATAPSLTHLPALIGWVRDASGDLRRRAILAASAGRAWRHPSLLDHVTAVALAEVRGVGDGLWGVAAGARVLTELGWRWTVQPERMAVAAITDGPGGAVRLMAEDERDTLVAVKGAADAMAMLDPVLQGTRMVHDVRVDGFWAAAEDHAHDSCAQVPAVAATLWGVAPGLGALAEAGAAGRAFAAAGRTASNVSNLSYAAPHRRGVGQATVRRLVALSVPVAGDPDRRVALDPSDGKFVVLQAPRDQGDGITGTRSRWSGLRDREREALQRAGIVDRKGHLLDR
jgi:hypothetical protein